MPFLPHSNLLKCATASASAMVPGAPLLLPPIRICFSIVSPFAICFL
jgi:hypothetical protein